MFLYDVICGNSFGKKYIVSTPRRLHLIFVNAKEEYDEVVYNDKINDILVYFINCFYCLGK